MESHPSDIEYGILTNMRNLAVFTPNSRSKVKEFSFSFQKLYKDYKESKATVENKTNTKRFQRFIQKFSYQELSLNQKFQRVKQGTPWTGEENLHVPLLTKRLDWVVERLFTDVKKQKDEIEDLINYDPERAQNIAQEIELIASEIDSAHELKEGTLDTLEEALTSASNSLYSQSLATYLHRVAYFAMTRLLLVRMWEDIGFITQTLYDGGLSDWYEKFNHELKQVLKHAFGLAGERYEWLFEVENNYTWYVPSDDSLIEVLYELSNFNLGQLNRDVLGTIYEEYIDEVDKKNKGQYYTPREIVSFIWDQVGFNQKEAYFKQKRGERKPVRIFDPASGSGGFLVEAARRIREDSNLNLEDFQDLLDIRSGIFQGLYGAEISVFPYYITEVNLLIQLTPVVKRMIEKKSAYKKEHLPLPVVRVDALSLHNPYNHLLDQTKEYQHDELRDVLPLDSRKKKIWQVIKEEQAEEFDYCCANPPYIGEKGNKELFRSTRERFKYWDNYYKGKMDYFYWFIILGLSKLREGGKLGFVTTQYWPTADGASELRKYLFNNSKINKLIFFNDVNLFEHAKGQHNMVFVLEKCSGEENQEKRYDNVPKIVEVKADNSQLKGDSISKKLNFLTNHIEKHISKDEYKDEYITVHWSGVKQGELPEEDPWHEIKLLPSEINFIRSVESEGEQIDPEVCTLKQGIVSGADKVTPKKYENMLPDEKIRKYGIEPRDGIFVLSQEEKDNLNLPPEEEKIIHRTYKNSSILPYSTNTAANQNLYIIYATKETDIEKYPTIKSHLKKFKDILKERRECKQNKIPWYSLQWPREEKLLQSTKIVTPRWGNEAAIFAFQDENFYENSDINLIVNNQDATENPLYILGLLNSQLLRNWMKKKAAQKGLTRQSVLSKIPIVRIDRNDNSQALLHDNIVSKVKTIREKISGLLNYSKYFKDPFIPDNSGRLEIYNPESMDLNLSKLTESLPPENLYSIRTHPGIETMYTSEVQANSELPISDIGEVERTLGGPQLEVKMKGNKNILLQGTEELLELVSQLIKEKGYKDWTTAKEKLLIPKKTIELQQKRDELVSTGAKLRNKILTTQEDINGAVEELYDR